MQAAGKTFSVFLGSLHFFFTHLETFAKFPKIP
uniref:Uncharacterized protein n=1 Tax=Neisseria meningitidis alpha275 TaxID=295996 RepID=C6SK08_NEIME|nr:hypothetical protein predicted by Glimmer/Critica [Neisseria meningitidis alpha275]